MGKLILFEKSYYDITGTYRCYDIDNNMSEDYVLVYDNPDVPIEINSILNIDTDFYVTIEYKPTRFYRYVNINYDIFDIKSYDTKLVTTSNISTQFNSVFLSRRNKTHSYIDGFNHLTNSEDKIEPGSPFATGEFTSEGQETFITEYINQQNCAVFPDYEECATRRDDLVTFYDTLSTKTLECETPLPTFKYKNIEDELKVKIIKLDNENKILTETWSTSEYVIGLLFLLGLVMFLYAVYISLYSPS